MLNDLADDILTIIFNMLNGDDFFLLCLNKYINNFMLSCYYKNKIIATKIPLYILKNANNLHTLILTGNDNIYNKSSQNLSKLKHLDLPRNDIITNRGLKNISLITNLNLSYNENITSNGLKYISHVVRLNLVL